MSAVHIKIILGPQRVKIADAIRKSKHIGSPALKLKLSWLKKWVGM